jgi:hypothetical protein
MVVRSYKSTTGGIFTTIITTLSLFGFIYFANIALTRVEPISSQNKQFSQYMKLRLNTSEYPIFFRLVHGSTANPFPDQESIYGVTAKNIKYANVVENGQTIWKRTNYELNIIKCGKDYQLPNEKFKEIFQEYDLTDFYTLAPNQTMEWERSPTVLDYFGIYFATCDQRPGCKPITEIDQILSVYNYQYLFVDHYINHLNYTNPLVPFVRKTHMSAGSALWKQMNHDLQKTYYHSDNGFLLDDVVDYDLYSTYKQIELVNLDKYWLPHAPGGYWRL